VCVPTHHTCTHPRSKEQSGECEQGPHADCGLPTPRCINTLGAVAPVATRVSGYTSLVMLSMTRICATVASSPRVAADRPRGTVDRVWVPTK